MLSLCLFMAHCSASVFSISYSTFYGKRGIELYLGADNHSLGSKAQNFEQLQYFFKNVLAQESLHLIAESKFFHGLHTSVGNNYEKGVLGNQIPFQLPQNFEWSVSLSPQKRSDTTWIAWELPFLLTQLRKDDSCSSMLNLSEAEINHIVQNISFEFLDPRVVSAKAELGLQGHIAPDQYDLYNVINTMSNVYNKFFDALQKLPEINASRLAQEISQLNLGGIIEAFKIMVRDDYNKDEIISFLRRDPFEAFLDLQILTSIINLVYDVNQNANNNIKIVALTGYRHVARLESLLKFVGFNQHQTATISENGHSLGKDLMQASSTLSDEWANKLCRLLSFIKSTKSPKRVVTPRVEIQNNREQNTHSLPTKRSLMDEFNGVGVADLELPADQDDNVDTAETKQDEKMELDLN